MKLESTRPNAAIPVAPSISEEERARRQAAVDTARASVGLEGFKISAAEEARAQCFIDGRLSLAEFVGQPVQQKEE